MLRAPGLLTLLLTITCSAFGQRIVEESGAPVTDATRIRAAAEEKPGQFPALSADTPNGSLVVASGDFHDSDVSILVEKSHIDNLKPKAMELLSRLNLRDSVIRISRGRVIGELDMELNNYMSIQGNRSHATVPLGTIVDQVKTWGLPEPFGVVIEGSKYSDVRYKGEKIETLKLLWPKEVGSNDKVEYNFERHWYGLVMGIYMAALLLAVVVFLWVMCFKLATKESVSFPARPRTLEEAQARYDQKNKTPISRLFPMLPILVVSPILLGREWMHDSENWYLGGPPGQFLSIFFFAAMILPLVGALVIRKIKRIPSPPSENSQSTRFMPYLLIPIIVLMVFIEIRSAAPQWFYGIPTPVLQWFIRIVGFGPIPIVIALLVVNVRKSTQVLAPGDVDYDAAFEIAAKSGIRIKKVVVIKTEKSANAFARLFGTIGLTQGARAKLSDEERRSVIAHELGHFKGQHVPQLVLLSLGLWGVVLELDYWATHAKLPPTFTWIVPLAGSPILFLPLLIVARAPFQRKAEFAADRFALEAIGDFTAVATSLAKIHVFNASPHTFTRFHESLASHPSLVNRLNSLRATAVELGMTVSPYEVDRIISGLSLEDDPIPSPPAPSPITNQMGEGVSEA